MVFHQKQIPIKATMSRSLGVDVNESGGHFQFLLLAVSFIILGVLHHISREFQKGNSFVVANTAVKKSLVRSFSFKDVGL